MRLSLTSLMSVTKITGCLGHVTRSVSWRVTAFLWFLRTVPTFVTAQMFCASRDTRISYGWCLVIQGYFARFKTIRRKQKLASTLGIQKENWG